MLILLCLLRIQRSNRTFMELKIGRPAGGASGQACSNRTFMELKLLTDNKVTKRGFVLIAPLWN